MMRLISGISYPKHIMILNLLAILLSILFMLLSPIFDFENYAEDNIVVNFLPETALFFVGVVVAPLFETYIFQFMLIELIMLALYGTNKIKIYGTALFISALFFALIHNYNLYYFIVSFTIGLILAFCYLHSRVFYHKSVWIAFFATAFIHSFYNLFAHLYNIVG